MPLRSKRLPLGEILLTVVVLIGLCAPVQRSPLRLFLEQAHGLDVLKMLLAAEGHPFPDTSLRLRRYGRNTHVLVIGGESMVNSRRKHNQIALLKPDPHPIITLAPNIEKPRAIKNVSDLLILVQMLVEETLDLLFVDVSHLLRGHSDFVPVLVITLLGQRIHIII